MTEKAALLQQLKLDRTEPPRVRPPLALWLAIAVAIGSAGVIAVWAWLSVSSGIAVHVATAQAAAAAPGAGGASLLDASGYVVARRQATVASKITDKVVQVLIEEGQHVDAGQVIARLDDSNTLAALAQARAQVVQASAALAAARVAFNDAAPNFARQQKLVQQGWVSHDTFETTKTGYDVAEANLAVAGEALKTAEAGLDVAQRNQDDTVIRAPFAGIVTVKAAQEGEIVSPISAGGGFTRTGIGTIVDMDSLEVEVDVGENFIHRVHPDQPATVRLNAYPDWPIPAAVIAVIPTADRAKATVKVRVAFKAHDPRILPEMGARVAFLGEPAGRPDAPAPAGVTVPLDSVHGQGDTGAVFVLHDGRVERRTVRLGARTAQAQTVLAGLSAGERVVVGEVAGLADGARVRIEE